MLGVRMRDKLTLSNMLNIYESEISKNVKNKERIYKFECKMQNIINIIDMLAKGNIGHRYYNIFIIYEPKCRLVMSLPVKDKIINHFITRYSLEKNLNKYLDIRNCATRKNMGTSYAIKLLKKYIEINKGKYHNFYILKIDIKKYFYNIDHEILKDLLKDKLNEYEYNLICKIIDTTNSSYINNKINYYKDNYRLDLPTYVYGKGLPIGNMTSQFLSIFYLYKLDYYIIHNLKLKYYIRYMDDFIIISHDLNKLKEAKKIIQDKLLREYKLEMHNKKTMITKSKDGFSFLGYTFKVINNKTIIKVKRSNYEKIKRKLKNTKYMLVNNSISYSEAFAKVMTYSNIYTFNRSQKMLNLLERYFYER